MTPNQAEVLNELLACDRSSPAGSWHAPMEFGGHNGSHHGVTARRMADRYGWVEWRYRGCDPGEKRRFAGRGSCLYRITPAGAQALANHQATLRLAKGT